MSIKNKLSIIDQLEPLLINGVKQWTLCRGNIDHPLLFVLHGGPGNSLIPWAHHFDRLMINDFLVVHWDQRHAGKSFYSESLPSSLTVQEYLNDAQELIRKLLDRFQKRKVILLGHSWGSLVGVQLTQIIPESIERYVSVGQAVSMKRSQEMGLEFLRNEFSKSGVHAADLNSLGLPPFGLESIMRYGQLIRQCQGVFRGVTHADLTTIAMDSPYVTLEELENGEQGSQMAFNLLESEINGFDALSQVPSIPVPIHFFQGRHDLTTNRHLVREFYHNVTAPEKTWVEFEDSAHFPMWEEPEKFHASLLKILK